jgi:hypothetical protein
MGTRSGGGNGRAGMRVGCALAGTAGIALRIVMPADSRKAAATHFYRDAASA